MIRTLTAFLASTGALWATAGQSLAHDFDGDGIVDDDCDPNLAYGQGYDPNVAYAPTQGVQQFGPSRVVAGPLSLDVVQSSDGRVYARVVASQIPLVQLQDTRIVLGFQGGNSVTLYYSPSQQSYVGTLPGGSWIGAHPAYAQILYPEVVVAPQPPVVHVVPYPTAPVVVGYPRAYSYPRAYQYPRYSRPRVVAPIVHRRHTPPVVVRVDPRGGSWQRAHTSGGRGDFRGNHDGRRGGFQRGDNRGQGGDGRGNPGRGNGGRGNGGRDGGGRGRGHR